MQNFVKNLFIILTLIGCFGFSYNSYAAGWVPDICSGVGIYSTDISGTIQWKTTNDSCASPQCSNGVLVDDSSVDFSLYPAQNACNAIGGRLPTKTELNCIYLNKANASLGSFQSSNYWSSEEYNATSAWYENLGTGFVGNYNKTYVPYVRCVQDYPIGMLTTTDITNISNVTTSIASSFDVAVQQNIDKAIAFFFLILGMDVVFILFRKGHNAIRKA